MIIRYVIAITGLLAALAFVYPRIAQAKESALAVRDDARIFDNATREKVDKIAQDISRRFHRDLIVQTFPTIPENLRAAFSAQKKDVFYENWLRREARAANASGVYILIVKNPGHLQVGVGNKTSQTLFTTSDRDELRDLLVARFRESKFDEGLIQAADFVAKRMAKNAGNGNGNIDSGPDALPAPNEALPAVPTTKPATTATTQPTTQPAVDSPATPTNNQQRSQNN